jgi:hypothetical protein
MAAIGLKFFDYATVWALEPAANFQAEGDCGDDGPKVNLFFRPTAALSSLLCIQVLR